MRNNLIIQRLREQGFNDKYINRFMVIYKASVIKNIPNPLYYTFVRMKNLTKNI